MTKGTQGPRVIQVHVVATGSFGADHGRPKQAVVSNTVRGMHLHARLSVKPARAHGFRMACGLLPGTPCPAAPFDQAPSAVPAAALFMTAAALSPAACRACRHNTSP